jgi:hypothetical protein
MRGFKGILYRFGLGLRRVVVIGDEEETVEVAQILSERKGLGYRVVGINLLISIIKLVKNK